jgi:hypothetical protein
MEVSREGRRVLVLHVGRKSEHLRACWRECNLAKIQQVAQQVPALLEMGTQLVGPNPEIRSVAMLVTSQVC